MKQKVCVALAALVLIAGTVQQSAAGSPGHTTLVLDLDGCIQTALQNAPEIGEAQADQALTESRLDEAKGYRLPQISLTSLVGPAPGAKKEDLTPVVNTEKSFNMRDLTWFTSSDIMITQPLWTFGKISENMKAAIHGIEVDKAKKRQKGHEVALEVKKYYYGLLLARELQGVIAELQQYMRQGKEKVQELIDNESAAGDPMDLHKIDAYSGSVNKYMEEAHKGECLATAALKARLGLEPGLDIDIPTDELTEPENGFADIGEYIEKARVQRPEFKQLAEGMAARTALVQAAKANYYPDIFLAGIFSWAYAEDRDKIRNPYISDSFNHLYGGVALGARWKLDFGITKSKVAGEQAQLNRLSSTRQFADTYIPLQVKKAWFELNEAFNNISTTKSSYHSAKKWGAAALANFDFGIGNPRDVFDAVEVYGKMKAAYYQSIYDYYIAKANLDYAIGENPVGQAK